MIPDWGHWLRSSASRATVYGDLDWRCINGSAYGRWDGTVCSGEPITLELRISPGRPDNPSVLLKGRTSCWHIDHNGSHRHEPPSTHLQYTGDQDFILFLDAAAAGSPPFGSRLRLSVLRSTLYLSAKLLNVDTRGTRWFDPPKEVLQ